VEVTCCFWVARGRTVQVRLCRAKLYDASIRDRRRQGAARRLEPARHRAVVSDRRTDTDDVKTLPSRTRLLDNLRQVRELGYATHVEESQRRIVAYACPVRDAAGTTRAAVVVAGPIVRFASYSAPSIIAKLQAAADATFADFTDSH